jgi:hypothetical protein
MFFRPLAGLAFFTSSSPRVKTLGYFQNSIADSAKWPQQNSERDSVIFFVTVTQLEDLASALADNSALGYWKLGVFSGAKKYRPPRPMGVKGGCSPQNNRENWAASSRAWVW